MADREVVRVQLSGGGGTEFISPPFCWAGVNTDRSASQILRAACLSFCGQMDRMRLGQMRPHCWLNVVVCLILKGPNRPSSKEAWLMFSCQGYFYFFFSFLFYFLLLWLDSELDYGSAMLGKWLHSRSMSVFVPASAESYPNLISSKKTSKLFSSIFL